jgi:SAM-dependent MidA family methyltransferase
MRASPAAMSNIRSIIEDELALRGPMPFARFMELALYCPNFGYYERLRESPGRGGDYFTSVSVGPLFGDLLAHRFAQWLGALPPGNRQIVEAGAHDGRLARDILRHLQAQSADLWESIEYWILEPSARRQRSQQKTLEEFPDRVRWFSSWDALPATGVRGLIFSNELLDALPVHRLGWDAVRRKWFEWGVGLESGRFVWEKLAKLTPDIPVPTVPDELLAVLPDGFTTEVCPAAIEWWRRAAHALYEGKLLAFDYGLNTEDFFAPERKHGTLRAYYRHHAAADVLARAGEQDLTASVNFTVIREAGESAGLVTDAFDSQCVFLTRIFADAKDEPAFKDWFSPRQFQTLAHPEHLGRLFRVLLQSRA